MNSTAKGINTFFFLLQVKPSNNIFRNSIFMREKERKRNIHTGYKSKPKSFLPHQLTKHMQKMLHRMVRTYLTKERFYNGSWRTRRLLQPPREGFPKSKLKLFLQRQNKKKMIKPQQHDVV